jgi:hypothetical protein
LTVVFDRESELQNGTLTKLARKLSKDLHCLTLAVANSGDSELYYRLFKDGRTLDKYDSCPNYFGGDGPVHPTGGKVDVICKAFRASKVHDRVDKILRYNNYAEDNTREWKYLDETERQRDLAKALKLPMFSVGFGYEMLAEMSVWSEKERKANWPKGLRMDGLSVIEGEDA